MANPTTAKPTGPVCAWLNTAATVGATTQATCPFGVGSPREVVGSILGVPHGGAGGSGAGPNHGTGHAPTLIPGGFTYGGLSDPVWRFGLGTTAVRWPGRGWSTYTYPHTIWAVFKPNHGTGGYPVVRTIGIAGNESGLRFHGIAYQLGLTGAVTLGHQSSTAFQSAAIALTMGHTYLVSLTMTSSTSGIFQVYDYDAQAYITPQSTGTTISTLSVNTVTFPDFVINPGCGWDGGYNAGSFFGDMYAAGLNNATFDPTMNGFFAALVANPTVESQGTYTATGTLTAGGIGTWDCTTSQITINSNAPTLGAAGGANRYQYRLHRSTTAGFTPSVGTQVTTLQSSPVLVDTTPVVGTDYFYKVEQTDGTSTVYSTTSTTNYTQVFGRLSKGDFFFTSIGDSRWSSLGSPNLGTITRTLRMAGYRCGGQDMSLASSAIYTTNPVLSWQPNLTQDPTNGQSGTTLLANALAAANGVSNNQYIISTLGINDVGTSTAAAIATKLGFVLNQLTAFTTLLNIPYLSLSYGEVGTVVLQSYVPVFAAKDNGTTVRYLGQASYDVSATGLESFALDGLHYVDSAFDGFAVASELLTYLGAGGGSGTGGSGAGAAASTGAVGVGYWTGDSQRPWF